MGLGLLPSMDYFNTKDTSLDVITSTIDYPDTLRVYGSDYHIVGNITDDAIFGKTNASIFFQLKPSLFPFYIPGNRDSLEVDSAVLILSYKGFYGDSTKPLVLNLKRIAASTPLTVDSTMYASNFPELYNIKSDVALADPYTLDFAHARDSNYNRFEAAASQIRIPLYQSFAKMFIKDFDTTNAYITDTALRK
jgi:hypothetical protein